MSRRGNPLWLPSPKSGTIWHWGFTWGYSYSTPLGLWRFKWWIHNKS